MSSLTVYFAAQPLQPLKVLTHAEDIAATLKEYGIEFCRLPAAGRPETFSEQSWLEHYQPILARVAPNLSEVGVLTDHVEHAATHQYDQTRAYLCAQARVLIHVHQQGYVFAIECGARDLLELPAHCAHWLRVGELEKPIILELCADAAPAMRLLTPDLAKQFGDLLP